MNVEDLTVVVPHKQRVTETEDEPVAIWPLVEAALDKIDADEDTRDAARAAIEQSDGCVALANYLDTQASRTGRTEQRYRAPRLVLAAREAHADGGVDSIYDPEANTLYFEADDDAFAFDVEKDWTVAWADVVDEEIRGYPWTGIENETWALDKLMDYLDVPFDEYLVDDDEGDVL